MERKRFSVELGMKIADATRRIGVSEQTLCRWKKLYGGLQSDQLRELKVLQDESAGRWTAA